MKRPTTEGSDASGSEGPLSGRDQISVCDRTEIGLKLCHVIFIFILRGIFLHMQMPLLEVIVLSEIRAFFLLCAIVLHPYFNDAKLMQMFSLELFVFVSWSLSSSNVCPLVQKKKIKNLSSFACVAICLNGEQVDLKLFLLLCS